MEEQPVVFDETFDEVKYVRRRALMPLGLKIYVWLGMMLGVLLFLAPLLTLLNKMPDTQFQQGVTLGITLGVGIPGIVLFLMTFLLWYEVKWAIKFNWAVGILWILIAIADVYLLGVQVLRLFLPSLIFAPYWIWLYSIQKKWEQ